MQRFSRLADWLSWLETLHPKSIDMGLSRVRVVAEKLGVVAKQTAPVITVAGTNGKGSTCALLESLLLAHGRHVGCYTSPHILRFNERIRINGADVGDEELVSALARVDEARGDISLTYFEFTTLAAFVLFREADLDAWILEVGLGGRLDAVNVIDADIAVLTSVGIDHTDWLGTTRESIGREKAGIFRSGKPAVVGDKEPPESVEETLRTLGANDIRAGRNFSWTTEAGAGWEWRGVDAAMKPVQLISLPLPVLALPNAAVALQGLHLLPFPVDDDLVRKALESVTLSGRNQRFEWQGREIILDVGHNADAFRFLRQELQWHGRGERFHVVLGMLADKDIDAALRVLEPLAATWHIAPLPSPRSATAMQLENILAGIGSAKVVACRDLGEALQMALATGDRLPLLVTGSFYCVSEAMKTMRHDVAEDERP